MIKLEVTLKDVDYEALFDKFFPVLKEKLGESDEPAARLMSGLPENLARKVLTGLTPAQKDKLAASVLNSQSRKLERTIDGKLSEQGIPIQVKGIRATAE
jgi:hypothetical protein